jgi:hypothetical protein
VSEREDSTRMSKDEVSVWEVNLRLAQCRVSTSVRPRPISSKSFPIHHLPIILLFDAMSSSY